MLPQGNDLICADCCSPTPLPWHEQHARDLGTGLAGRRKEAQSLGATLAPKLQPVSFFAVQARERWSLSEDLLYRPGHYWVAESPDVLEVREIAKRETIQGQPFSPGDYMIRIGRYFDRDPSDPSGLTFEEWLPELVFTPDDVGSSLTITAAGSVKVENHVRTQIFWDDIQPPVLSKVTISKVTDEWVTYGKGKRDRFRNVRVAGSFVVNSTELRAVNFSMEVLDRGQPCNRA